MATGISSRVIRLGLATVLLWAGLAAAPALAHDAPNYCGSQTQMGAGWYDVYGHRVGCERARRIARKWEYKCINNQPCREGEIVRINEWPGFRCRYRDAGYEVVRVRCVARGDRIVHFYWGS